MGKVRRGYIVKFPHPMYFSLRWAEERMPCAYATLFSPTKVKIHGVWTFNNITPSHLSHPVDTFSALPSMAVGWCLHRLLRRKTKKLNSPDSPSMAVCVCYALLPDEGKNTGGVQIGIWEKFITISSPVYVNNFQTVTYIVESLFRLSKDRFRLFR